MISKAYHFIKPLIVFLLLFGTETGKAQNNITWADSCKAGSFYGKIVGMDSSEFWRVHDYPGGDLILVGTIKDNNASAVNYKIYGLVMRISKTGQLIWSRFIGFADPLVLCDTKPRASVVTGNGNIMVVANIKNGSTNKNFAIRLDGSGTIVWQKEIPGIVYPHQVNDIYMDIIQTSDGGFFMGGRSESSTNAAHAGIFRKLDANGNSLWQDIWYNSPTFINIKAVTETATAYCFTGMYRDFMHNFVQNYMVGVNKTDGSYLWMRSYDFLGSAGQPMENAEYEFSSLSYNNGIISMAGCTNPDYIGTRRPAQIVLNTDENGELVSVKRIESNIVEMERFNDSHSSLYDARTGTGVQFKNADTSDFYVYRLNTDNSLQWAWRIMEPAAQVVLDSKVLNDSSVVIAGKTTTASGLVSATLLKTSSGGKLENCTNQQFQVTTAGLFPQIVGQDGLYHSNDHYLELNYSSVEIINGYGFNWQLNCINSIYSRLSKISGSNIICSDSLYLFSVTRDNNFNPVAFSTNGPGVIIPTSDTSANIRFTSTGTFVLYARLQSDCGELKDSMIIEVKRKGSNFSLGTDRNLCANNTYKLHAPAGYMSYQWQDNSTDSVYTVTQPGNYYVTVTDACGGSFSDTINIYPEPPFSFSAGSDRIKCNSDTLHISAPAGFFNYSWSPDYNISSLTSQQVVVNPLTDTSYFISAEKYTGCLAFDTIKIRVNRSPDISLGNDTAICEQEVLLLNAGPGFSSYLWNNTVNAQTFLVNQAGTYMVIAEAANGCHSGDTITIDSKLCLNDIYIPTAFTPNNDGLNDVFKAKTSLVLKKYSLVVYNRWGQKIFETTDINEGWNGDYKGAKESSNVFVWVCNYQVEGKSLISRKGNVILIK